MNNPRTVLRISRINGPPRYTVTLTTRTADPIVAVGYSNIAARFAEFDARARLRKAIEKASER